MGKGTTETSWQRLAESWVGLAPRDSHFDSWMELNLHPPISGLVPDGVAEKISADPRALSFARRHLRSSFQWESTWVGWMPNNPISILVLEPREAIERAVLLAGAVCCRELIATTIARTGRQKLAAALGPDVPVRLASRPGLSKLQIPAAARPASWGADPAETLRHSGILCLRTAISLFPPGLEARLAALVPGPAWSEKLPPASQAEADAAAACIDAGRKLDHPL
jgi:hypothetical protein